MRPGRSDISLKNWLPHGASGPLAKEARRYVRDNIAGSSLAHMGYDENGMSPNLGCAAGLESHWSATTVAAAARVTRPSSRNKTPP